MPASSNTDSTECTETETCQSWEQRLDELNTKLQNVISVCKGVISENKQLRKEYTRVNRELAKRTRKKKTFSIQNVILDKNPRYHLLILFHHPSRAWNFPIRGSFLDTHIPIVILTIGIP